jgi:hypothetical protein
MMVDTAVACPLSKWRGGRSDAVRTGGEVNSSFYLEAWTGGEVNFFFPTFALRLFLVHYDD